MNRASSPSTSSSRSAAVATSDSDTGLSMQMPAVPEAQPHRRLRGKRVAMLSLSLYPGDPRPRRAAQALRDCGMDVDFIGVNDGKSPSREALHGINVLRLPIEHKRGGKLAYAYEYSAFI